MKNLNYQKFFIIFISLGLSIIIGIAIGVFSPFWILSLLGIICSLFILVKKPELAILAILAITSTIIFERDLPLIGIGIGSLSISDLLLVALFGLAFFRGYIKPGLKVSRTPLDLPLFSFYCVALFSTFLAINNGSVNSVLAFRAMRVLTYYLSFFIVVNLIQKKSQLNYLINGILILGTVVAVAMIVQDMAGATELLLPGRVETAATQEILFQGATRILPPGQSLVFLSFITLVVLLVIEKAQFKSITRFLITAVLGMGVLLTFNRNFWVGVAFAFALLIFLVRDTERKKITKWILLIVIIISISLPFISTGNEIQSTNQIEAFLTRFATLFDVNTLNENSLRFRLIEIEYAIPQILAHPIIGLGLGSYYRPLDLRLDWESVDFRDYIHNGQLGLILNTGFIGYFCFIWLSAIFIWRGLKYWKTIQPLFEKAIFLANTLAFMGIFTASIVSPVFQQSFWTPVFGIMMGTNEVIFRLYKSSNNPVEIL